MGEAPDLALQLGQRQGAVVLGRPAAVDPEAAWRAMALDKKARDGRVRLVLLDAPGRPVYGIELPDDEVRAVLGTLVAA